MAHAMTWVEDLDTYSDGSGTSGATRSTECWAARRRSTIAVERDDIPAMVSDYLRSAHGVSGAVDATPVVARMRMVKSAEELDMIRQAGQVAIAMGKEVAR